ncbi:MAG TPA: chain length determinant protein tyrosine kinase EpsG, partial [Rhodoferax sp.]
MTTPNTITKLATRGSNRNMGDMLVASGRLRPDDLQSILDSQTKKQIPFGEAAIALNLLTKADIDLALSQQFDYAYLPEADLSLSPHLVAAYKPFSRISESLRAIRSQLMLRWLNGDPLRKALA